LVGESRPLTHRQYLAWQAWLNEQWNHPSLSDHYLMQIAAEVRRVLSRKPNEIKLEHFNLKFGRPEPVDQTSQAELAKAAWATRLGKRLDDLKDSSNE